MPPPSRSCSDDPSGYQHHLRLDEAGAVTSVLLLLDEQVADTLNLSSVTIAEILFGVAVLPAGDRQQRLSDALNGLVLLFGRCILRFDIEAARYYAELAFKARRAG